MQKQPLQGQGFGRRVTYPLVSMPLPRIAIVGRPNAGKSSLMNMIAGAKVSIVDPTPGVTRDRVSAIVDVPAPFKSGKPKTIEFVDTGGFGVYVAEGGRYDEIGSDLSKLTGSIEDQIARAVDDADLILFAIDVQNGVTPYDREIATLLREGAYGAKRDGKKGDKKERKKRKTPPVRIVATKTDGPKWELHTADLAALGFGEPLLCSARTNYFRREFLDAIYEMMPVTKDEEKSASVADLMVAIVGKRNAGKSTLVNTLAGEPRMIVSEIAGTTRDAVDVRFEFDGKSMVAIDTAGLRRKRSFQSMIEHYAFDRVQRSIDRAEVVLMMVDASDKISQVDEHLAQLVAKSYKPAIIVVNKWDAVEGQTDDHGRKVTVERFETYIRGELKGLAIAPIAFISGQSGRNVKDTMRLAFELKAQSYERVTTGKLNRLIRGILETRGPTDTVGTMAKVYYVAQTGIAPPTITMVVNHPDLFTSNYLRFLMNRFREELPFTEVPIRIVVRARRQREDDLRTADGADEAAEPRRIGR
ncbi:MAG: ribosome biogenesis GTPase Der, partial [bacterium]|nr:ribosome biogenesis GTPase Der [bacterium]